MSALGLYIDLPFCIQRCSYCAFAVRGYREGEASRYLAALLQEARMAAHTLAGPRIETVYLGGGTPTHYPVDALARLLEVLRECYVIADGAEVSVEAHPETLDLPALSRLKRLGVNRLSLGVQSLHAEDLRAMGRRYAPERVERVLGEARAAGFDNIAVDLIYGLPGQSFSGWASVLRSAIALEPEHLSVYGLSIEPGTLWGKKDAEGALSLPGEEEEIRMFSLAEALLKENGYEHYEISNYAKPGCRCRHNLLYWKGGDYLGVGLAAHSSISGKRWSNTEDLWDYLRFIEGGTLPVTFEETLTQDQRLADKVIFGLRRIEGVRWTPSHERLMGKRLTRLIQTGLLLKEGGVVRLTDRGILLADEVAIRLI